MSTSHESNAPPRPPLTYRDAGVDIDAGAEVVRRIASHVAATHTPGVLSDIGGFGGLFAVPSDVQDPILVSGTDGVGTKLQVAFDTGRHDTVGIDLVAMSVNDILTTGARPLFFLDYLATGRLEPAQAEAVIQGIAAGCRQAGCALLGGETAELPGFYPDGTYDLAGFAVGVVSRHRLIDGRRIAPGDRLLGLPASGLHSNGYSLARKALLEVRGLSLDAPLPGTQAPVADVLLTPTRIYTRPLAALEEAGVPIHGIAHITGGGLVDNPPRILPDGLGMSIQLGTWPEPPVFAAIAAAGVPPEEMRRTFNLGIGLLLVVPPTAVGPAKEALASLPEPLYDEAQSGDKAQFRDEAPLYEIGVVTETPGVPPAVTFVS